MRTDAADENWITADLAAKTRLPSGRLVVDEIMDATNLIRAARKARWTAGMIRPLEDGLIDALAAFAAHCRRIDGA